MCSGLVALHLESKVAVLANYLLSLRGAVLPGSAKHLLSKHQKTKMKRHSYYAPHLILQGLIDHCSLGWTDTALRYTVKIRSILTPCLGHRNFIGFSISRVFLVIPTALCGTEETASASGLFYVQSGNQVWISPTVRPPRLIWDFKLSAGDTGPLLMSQKSCYRLV